MQKACIIIPCFNEAERLPVSEFEKFLESNDNIHFLFCDDGSTDNTLDVLNRLKNKFPGHVAVTELQKNSGKAEAVRIGVLRALQLKNCDYIGYFDADLSTPLAEIHHLISKAESSGGKDFVFGSRIKYLGNDIVRLPLRHYFGRVFATLASETLNLPVYDTQCGAKIFKSHLVEPLFSQKFITRWLFDVELFARLIQTYGYPYINEKVLEVPLNKWTHVKNTKIKIQDLIKIPAQFLLIRKHYDLKKS